MEGHESSTMVVDPFKDKVTEVNRWEDSEHGTYLCVPDRLRPGDDHKFFFSQQADGTHSLKAATLGHPKTSTKAIAAKAVQQSAQNSQQPKQQPLSESSEKDK